MENRDLKFSWNPASKEGTEKDQIMMLAYDIELAAAVYTTTGQFRTTGSDTLSQASLAKGNGKNYHVYAAFNAADRSQSIR